MAAAVGLGTITALQANAMVPDELVAAQQAIDADVEGSTIRVPHGAPHAAGTLKLSMETVVLSALLFIGIFTWLEFLRSWFDNTFAENGNLNVMYLRFWYAIFITALVAILFYVVYRAFN
jgi:hypothetical protein